MNDHTLDRLEARLAALDGPIAGDVDMDALGAAIGLTEAEIAAAKAWVRSLPPGLSEWETARLAGEEFGLHPGDILAEAREIMLMVETLP